MTKKDKKEKLFIYGTLKRGGSLNSFYMKDSTFIKEDEIKGTLYSLGPFPALVEGSNDVPGEIFEVPINDFERVKAMEESAGYKTMEKETVSGSKVKVFIYESEISYAEKIKEW